MHWYIQVKYMIRKECYLCLWTCQCIYRSMTRMMGFSHSFKSPRTRRSSVSSESSYGSVAESVALPRLCESLPGNIGQSPRNHTSYSITRRRGRRRPAVLEKFWIPPNTEVTDDEDNMDVMRDRGIYSEEYGQFWKTKPANILALPKIPGNRHNRDPDPLSALRPHNKQTPSMFSGILRTKKSKNKRSLKKFSSLEHISFNNDNSPRLPPIADASKVAPRSTSKSKSNVVHMIPCGEPINDLPYKGQALPHEKTFVRETSPDNRKRCHYCDVLGERHCFRCLELLQKETFRRSIRKSFQTFR